GQAAEPDGLHHQHHAGRRPREQVELHRPGRRSDSGEQTLRLRVGGLPPPIAQASVSACGAWRDVFYSRCQTARGYDFPSSPRKRGPKNTDLSVVLGLWVPAFAGTTAL